MIIKAWSYGQVVDKPDEELNRIEENTEYIVDGLPWVDWPALSYKYDRIMTDYISADEIDNMENNCKEIAIRYHLPFNHKPFIAGTNVNHLDFNRWEQTVAAMVWLVERGDQNECCGTFNCGQGGLI